MIRLPGVLMVRSAACHRRLLLSLVMVGSVFRIPSRVNSNTSVGGSRWRRSRLGHLHNQLDKRCCRKSWVESCWNFERNCTLLGSMILHQSHPRKRVGTLNISAILQGFAYTALLGVQPLKCDLSSIRRFAVPSSRLSNPGPYCQSLVW